MEKIIQAVDKLTFFQLMDIGLERIIYQFSLVDDLCILIFIDDLILIHTVDKPLFKLICTEMEKVSGIIPYIIFFFDRTAISTDFIFLLYDQIIPICIICKRKS